MPDGNRVGSARRLPLASRVAAIQQSSMLTYRYPSRSSPLATTASAIPLIRFSSMLQPNLFQLFQPIGGAALTNRRGGRGRDRGRQDDGDRRRHERHQGEQSAFHG